MSYEDLEKARAERAIKKAAKEAKKAAKKIKKVTTVDKGTGSRKRKSPEEVGMPELKAKIARISGALVEENETAPEPYKAPVAQMW
jgi:hypothetical protein